MLARSMARELLSIIGAGRVGRALWAARFANEAGKSARWSRAPKPAAREAVRNHRRAVRRIRRNSAIRLLAARIILITTPDDAIAEAAEELARIGGQALRGKIVLHTSGALAARRVASAAARMRRINCAPCIPCKLSAA